MRTRKLLIFFFILPTLFFFSNEVQGQSKFGIKASGGLSRIINSMKSENAALNTQFAPSGQAGLFFTFQFEKKSMLSAEFLLSQIEGKEILETKNDENIWFQQLDNGYFKNMNYRHITYLSLPIYYGLRFNRLTINAGFQGSYTFSSSGRSKSEATLNGTTYTSDEKMDNINIKKIDLGPRAGIIYQFIEKLAIEGTYYYGFNNIQKGDAPIWKLKVQQITFGIRYTLGKEE